MRPVPGAMDRRQGGEADDALPATPTANMACFITTEAALDACSDDSDGPQFYPSCSRRKRSLESSSRPPRSQLPSPAPTGDSIASLSSSALCSDVEPETPQDRSPLLAPETLAEFSGPVSTVSSRRHSLGASSPQRRGHSAAPSSDEHSRRGPAPQLIMPSLAVPQRRPFSEAGKSVGKLKLLVAGSEGIGKTSLIHAIAHSCEHIVHIDPVSSASHHEFSELWASTRPRPWWRGESDLTASRKRRRSSAGDILDRNVCFVVRSALQQSASPFAESEYVDAQLSMLLEKQISDADLSTILCGGGESIVDAVLFLIPHTGLEVRDTEVIRCLQAKTNVIPLLARSDELDSEAVQSSKERIRQQIEEQGLHCFSFHGPGTEPGTSDILAVSSATQADYDVMDASILMSSGYVQPLVATDLENLVGSLFSVDGSAWLRHTASEKCIQWRKEQNQGRHLNMALMHRDPTKCALSPVLTANPFMQRQQWSRIEVSNWAQGLRHSLEAERCEHAAVQRALVESHRRTPSRDLAKRQKEGSPLSRQAEVEARNLTHQDPLGLLHIGSSLKKNSRLTCELMSSLGLLGCFAAWIVKVSLRSGAKATGQGRLWLDLFDMI